MAGLRRYGHCSVLLTPDVILTAGGFGDHGGRHCRLTELHMLVKHEDGWRSDKVRLAKLGTAWGKRQRWGYPLVQASGPSLATRAFSFSSADGRLFHTTNVLCSGWAVVLGGRKSPVSPALPPLRLKGLADADPLSPGSPIIELALLPPVEGLSVPRWRHTATEVTHEGRKEKLTPWAAGGGEKRQRTTLAKSSGSSGRLLGISPHCPVPCTQHPQFCQTHLGNNIFWQRVGRHATQWANAPGSPQNKAGVLRLYGRRNSSP